MALHDLTAWRHGHDFNTGQHGAEWRTWVVVAITAITMVAEILGGWITGSMALLADGWHMGTHVVALAITAVSYLLARRWSRDSRFAFGTWKIEILGAFSSALVLGIIALVMAVESAVRLVHPQPIAFGSALAVAVVGFVVNVVSAFVLSGNHEHDHDHDHDHHGDHGHDHGHDHDHDHGDLNLRAAYMHVLADALTSVLAIVALVAGMLAGWNWLDPAMGIVGAGVIAWWSKGILAQSARVLLDREMDTPVAARVRAAIERDGDAEIADLHLWRVGRERYACILAIVAHQPLTPDGYRERLAGIDGLAHVSVEVNRCPHLRCP